MLRVSDWDLVCECTAAARHMRLRRSAGAESPKGDNKHVNFDTHCFSSATTEPSTWPLTFFRIDDTILVSTDANLGRMLLAWLPSN